MVERGPRWLFWLVAGVVLAVALWARLAYDVNRSEDPRSGEWVSLEPDSFYHMRRTERLLREGPPVAGSDPALDYPDGADIPWPPYYASLLGLVAALVVDDPSAPGAWLEIERLVASLPIVFGCLGVLLAAWGARRMGGNVAAGFAGMASALALGPVIYGGIGNGDHHAFVSLLHLALLIGLCETLRKGWLSQVRTALLAGTALGVLVGVGIGSWVAFMVYLLEIELLGAVLIFRHTRRPMAGLGPFGLGLHLAALLVLLPACWQSPWQAAEPWSVVNLSAFQPFFLVVGAAVFVPLSVPGFCARLGRAYPWIVGALLATLFGGLLVSGLGPGAGLREAFSWLSREDRFMASVHESSSLFDGVSKGLKPLLQSAGHLIWLLPIAWSAALVAWRRGQAALLPWLIAVPLLALQAMGQLRFAEALVAPAAVLVGWALARLVQRRRPSRVSAQAGLAGLALIVGAASQWPAAAEIARYTQRSAQVREATAMQQERGATRRLCEWLRELPPDPQKPAVLASWGDGHMIEWVARRPTIATNFGSYLGQKSFRFGPRVFLCEEDRELERLLEEREVGYLLLTSRMTERLPDFIARADPELFGAFLSGDAETWRGGLRPRWFGTLLARMIWAGSELGAQRGPAVSAPPGFLRLVQVSPEFDPAPVLGGLISRSPRAWLWERVPGARLVFHGSEGSQCGVRFGLRYAGSDLRLSFESIGQIGADGTGSLRIPYHTDAPNGNARVQTGAIYWIGAGRGALHIPTASVLDGARLDLY